MQWEINPVMNDYPEKLVNAVMDYIENHKGSELLHYDFYTSTPYKDKSITSTVYRAYILFGNLFEVMRYRTCSKPEWNYDEVDSDSMIAHEIKICFEKSRFFN